MTGQLPLANVHPSLLLIINTAGKLLLASPCQAGSSDIRRFSRSLRVTRLRLGSSAAMAFVHCRATFAIGVDYMYDSLKELRRT